MIEEGRRTKRDSEVLAGFAVLLVAILLFATFVGMALWPQVRGCVDPGPSLEEVLEP